MNWVNEPTNQEIGIQPLFCLVYFWCSDLSCDDKGCGIFIS